MGWIFEEQTTIVDETEEGVIKRTRKRYYCSECGFQLGYDVEHKLEENKFCRNCGANMQDTN